MSRGLPLPMRSDWQGVFVYQAGEKVKSSIRVKKNDVLNRGI